MRDLGRDDGLAGVAGRTVEGALAGPVAAAERRGGDAGGGRDVERPVVRLHVRRVLGEEADRPARGGGDAATDLEVLGRPGREVDRHHGREDDVPVERGRPLADRDARPRRSLPPPEFEVGELAPLLDAAALREGEADQVEVVGTGPQADRTDGLAGGAHAHRADGRPALHVEAAREFAAEGDRVAAHRGDRDEQTVGSPVLHEDAGHLEGVLRTRRSGREVDVHQHRRGRTGPEVAALERHRDHVRHRVHGATQRVPEGRVRDRAVRHRKVVHVRDVGGRSDADPAEVDHADRDAHARIRHVERGGEDAGRVARDGAGGRRHGRDAGADGPAHLHVRGRAGVGRRAIAARVPHGTRVGDGAVRRRGVGRDLRVGRGSVLLGGGSLHRRGAASESGEERETEGRGLHCLCLL